MTLKKIVAVPVYCELEAFFEFVIKEHRGLLVNRAFKSFTPQLYFFIEYLYISVKITI